jgi:hypothetical protein
MIDNKRIIITMTSWKKRIGNVPKVVFSLLNNSVKPDLIVCNLALEEFPDKKIPDELQLLDDTGVIEIYWVEKNTTVFKKFIPTIKRFYGEDYFLFTVDDDELYDKDYIKTGIEALKMNKAVVIAARGNERGVWGGMFCCHSTVFKQDYWEHITEELMNERMNDPYTNAYFDFYKINIFNVNKRMTTKFNDVNSNRGIVGGYTPQKIEKVKKIVKRIFDTF